MNTWKEQMENIQNKMNDAVKSVSQEIAMENNTNKVVEQVKENVNKMVNAGKEAATNPRVIGQKLAETFNKIGAKKGAIGDAFKMGLSMFKDGLKEVKEGYQETRKKDETPTPPPDKTSI